MPADWRIVRGDCVEQMQAMPDALIDAVVCDPPTGYWLAGLIDGEGCFRIHSQRCGDYYAPTFSLKLRDDDAPILHEIVARTGIGRVRLDRSRSGNSRPCAVWRVDSRATTEALAALLDRYPLRTRKARDYAVWRRAIDVRAGMVRGNRWHGPRDWTPLIDLKRELEQAREYALPEGG
jgi:hypothetical protein